MEHRLRPPSRRGILTAAAAGVTTAALAACAKEKDSGGSGGGGTEGLDVIVIGAGVAGLSTARELTDGGKKVAAQVLKQLGGR
jgi:NADPH-dependent 2,4-dienoyl-CoA reductase/sulfur reductase-like enzyme